MKKIIPYLCITVFLNSSISAMQNDPMTRGAKRKLEALQATQELQEWIDSNLSPFPKTPETLARLNKLIAQGADVNTKGKVWAGEPVLMYTIGSKNISATKALLEAGADINAQNRGGFTAITQAVVDRSPALVHLLLENGADPTIKEKRGWSALSMTNTKNCHCKGFQKIKDLMKKHTEIKRIV